LELCKTSHVEDSKR